MSYRFARLLIAGLSMLALTLPGCAEEREPINRVQSDALAKSFFVGDIANPDDDPEFYWRNFVVDASESQSLIGIGSWSGVDRIRWEITENLLLARRAYAQNPGADDKGGNTGPADGTLVAAYPIESHFDIKRDYNPSTGEELNVVVENTTDRPWYQREFMRVDWSINVVDSPLWYDMFAGKALGGLDITPIAYYVNDANHPDAPHFVPEQGYFDVTSKFWVEPEQVVDGSGSAVPMCWLMSLYAGSAVDNCDPQEAVIRSSYWKVKNVDLDDDFEPFENSLATLDIIGNPGGIGDSGSVGIVTPPRIEWDPQYGYTDANFHRVMHHHNIWKQSHQTEGTCSSDNDCKLGACLPSGTCGISCQYDSRGDRDNNGTDDQCENDRTGYDGHEGSQCSMKNRCTIPYRDREIQPVGFWMNKETPKALTDTVDEDGNFVSRGPTEDLVYSWNQLMEHSVAKAREVECRRTGDGSREECNAKYFEPGKTDMVSFGGWGIERVKKMDDVLVGCHNPVRSYDPELCGAVGESARVGDLRKNFLFYWPYSSRAPWGGIANWNADPLTGRIIGASATTMGRSATFAAAMERDIIMVANGELDINDITDGVPAYLYQKTLQDGRTPKTYTKEEIEKRVQSIDARGALDTISAYQVDKQPGESARAAVLRQKTQMLAQLGTVTPQDLEFEAVANKLRGSLAEAKMIDRSALWDLAGLPSNTDVTDQVLDKVSPLRGADSFNVRKHKDMTDLGFQARGICFTDPEVANIGNQDVQGVAEFFRQKYSDDRLTDMYPDVAERGASALSKKRAELIYDDLWKDTYKGIALHEMGHALGMLHQFTSSYDSTNYDPQYWQLRTEEGKAMASCQGEPRSGDDVFDSDADTCMGPRYLDPETDDELGRKVVGRGADARIEDPRPGINYFANTSTMEYQNERFFETVGLGQFDLHTMNALYGRVLQTYDSEASDGLSKDEQFAYVGRLYSQLIDDNLVVKNNALTTEHYTSAARGMKLYDASRCRPATDKEIAHAEWRIVHGKVCSPPPKDYAAWDDFTNDPTVDGQFIGLSAPRAQVKPDRPGAGNYRWPYRWGVGTNSYPHANSTDAGADIYELTMETIRKFDYSYIFNYFRRGRRDWYYGGVPARTAGSFFERLRGYHWSIAITNSFLRGQGEETFVNAAEDDDDWRPYLMAETEMFDAIARAFLMPQIGSYRKAENFQQSDPTRDLFDPDGEELDPETGQMVLGSDAEFYIDASSGRFIDPAFASGPNGGGSWDYQNWLGWIGFGSEKVDALRTLVDGRSVFFFVSRSNYLDGRNLNINFRADMGRAVDRLLGGLLSRDWESIAPYVERGVRTPQVQIMNLNDETPARPPSDESLLLFPNVSYRQQLGALIWGHLFSRLNTDLSLSNKLRIYVDGFQSQLNIPDDQQIRFYNPDSGFTYIARTYGKEEIDGRMVDAGIASRMLERANLMLMQAYDVEEDDDGQPLFDQYHTPILKVDDDGRAMLKEEYEETSINTLRNYVGLLDMAVQVNDMIGYGPIPDQY